MLFKSYLSNVKLMNKSIVQENVITFYTIIMSVHIKIIKD